MLPITSYQAAARRLRHYADQIERNAKAATPREHANLTRAIYGASTYARLFAQRHRRRNER
jgi:hypothetical protein